MKKIRIVLAHGEHWARDYVRALIDAQEDMQVVAEAGDPRELSQVLSVARVDCLILRWPMGTAGSATALHSLKQACPSPDSHGLGGANIFRRIPHFRCCFARDGRAMGR
jgi:DNA-binding NarL/FixJ family response regulator